MGRTIAITGAALMWLALTAANGPARAASPAGAPAVQPATAKPAPRREAVRTLDAIRIEGEIDVPQVLFITARECRRFRDGTGARYQAASADVVRSLPLPSTLRVVAPIE